MAEHDRDEELSRRYRELAREEPPRALDDVILAAARREVRSQPAPLVAPSGRRRWFVPVAAAAVIVLSAVVTLHVQREQPDAELGAPQMSQAPARKDEAPEAASRAEIREEQVAPKQKERDELYSKVEPQKVRPERRQRQAAPSPKPATPPQPPAGEPSALARAPVEAKPAEQERFSPDPGPVAAAPPPSVPAPQAQIRPSAPAKQPAPRAADSASSASGAATPPATAGAAPPATAEDRKAFGGLRDSPRLDQRSLAKREAQAEPPERMLERIAALRREGRVKEADELYAEFKRRYPDYRIPDALREQVLPR
jgi:hypothetical protein